MGILDEAVKLASQEPNWGETPTQSKAEKPDDLLSSAVRTALSDPPEWVTEPIGAGEVFKKIEDPKSKLPVLGSIHSAVKYGMLYKATNRLESGQYDDEKQKEQDLVLVRKYLKEQQEEAIRGYTTMGRIAQGVTELPAFVGEFIMTGGLGAGAKAGVKKVGEKAVAKVAKEMLEKKAVQLGIKGLGWAAEGAARTAGMPQRVASGMLERMLPRQMHLTDKGKLMIEEAGDKPATAFMKAFGDTLAENLSETSGAGLASAAGKVTKVGKGLVSPELSAKLAEAYQKLRPGKSLAEAIKKTGYDGFLEEMGEERIGDLLRAAVGINDVVDPNTGKRVKDPDLLTRLLDAVPNGEQLLVEAGVIAVPTGASAALNTGAKSVDKLVARKQLQEAMRSPEAMLAFLKAHPQAQVFGSNVFESEEPSRKTFESVLGVDAWLSKQDRSNFARQAREALNLQSPESVSEEAEIEAQGEEAAREEAAGQEEPAQDDAFADMSEADIEALVGRLAESEMAKANQTQVAEETPTVKESLTVEPEQESQTPPETEKEPEPQTEPEPVNEDVTSESLQNDFQAIRQAKNRGEYENLVRRFSENAPDGTIVTDPDTGVSWKMVKRTNANGRVYHVWTYHLPGNKNDGKIAFDVYRKDDGTFEGLVKEGTMFYPNSYVSTSPFDTKNATVEPVQESANDGHVKEIVTTEPPAEPVIQENRTPEPETPSKVETSDDLSTFLDGKSNLTAGRMKRFLLTSKIRYNGQVMRRKEYVEALMSEGRILDQRKGKNIARNKEGDFLELNKTERDYFNYLTQGKQAEHVTEPKDVDPSVRRKALLDMSAMEIPEDRKIEVTSRSLSETWKKVKFWAESKGVFREVRNTWDGTSIRIDVKKVKGALSKGAGPQKIQLVGILPEMIKDAVPIDIRPNYKDSNITDHHYATKVKMDGQDYYVTMVVHQTDAYRYYDHELTQIEKLDDITDKRPRSNTAGRSEIPRASLLSILRDFIKSNPKSEIGNKEKNNEPIAQSEPVDIAPKTQTKSAPSVADDPGQTDEPTPRPWKPGELEAKLAREEERRLEKKRAWEKDTFGDLNFDDPQDSIKIVKIYQDLREESRWLTENVHKAYRNVQKPVSSPMPDTQLWAMPGKEKEMAAIGKKMAELKPLPKTSNRIPRPSTPGLPSKGKEADIVKIVFAAAQDPKEGDRYGGGLSGVSVKGDMLMATDGKRFFAVKGQWGDPGIYQDRTALKKGLLGKPTSDENVKFPDMKCVFDSLTRNKKYTVTDLPTVWRRVRQAMTMMDPNLPGVLIYANPDGSLGFASASPEEGHAEINIQDQAKVLGAINGEYLLDILRLHARQGDKSFSMWFDRPNTPMHTEGEYNGVLQPTRTVTMPITNDIEETINADKAEQAARRTRNQQALDARSELGDALDELGNYLKNKTFSNPLADPTLWKLTARLTAKAIKAGIYTFAEFVQSVASEIGHDQTLKIGPLLTKSWDAMVQVDSSKRLDPAGDVADILTKPKAEPNPSDTTSIKNEIVDNLRAKRGLAAMENETPESKQQWLDQAERRITDDPTLPERLVRELNESPRTLDPDETAVLQIHYRRLHNAFAKATDRLFAAQASGDPVQTATAQTDTDLILDQLQKTEEATKAAGREWGRAGVARQIELLQDYSLANLVRRARVAKGGHPLTEAENAKIKALSEKITDLQTKLEQHLAEHDATVQNKKIDHEIRKAVARKPKQSAKRTAAKQAVEVAWKEFETKARGKLFSNPLDPELVTSAAKIVKAYIDLGVVTFSEFMAAAREQFGDKAVKARDTFSAAWDQIGSDGGVPLIEIDPDDGIATANLTRKLTRFVVESGITDREAVVDAVHAELQQVIPDITRRQTMDAISGYGQYRELTKDEISVKIRDINGQLQQLAKLDDMQKGEAPSKTGVERREPSDEERRLIQQVNEAKKRGGFAVTNPDRQLKSALDSAKTALKNRIADLEQEIKTRKKIVKERTALEPDAELAALRAKRDKLIEEHAKLFPKQPMTQAQKIEAVSKALDRAIESLESDLKAGNITPKPKSPPISTPQLDAKRKRLEALRQKRDDLRNLANPKLTKEQRETVAYKKMLTKKLAEYRRRIADGDFARPPAKQKTYDKTTLDLKYELEQAKMKFKSLEDVWKRQQRTRLQKIMGTIPETLRTSRNIITSIDFGAVFRQGGWVVLSHPVLAAKVLPTMFKATFSKKYHFATTEDIHNRPNGLLYRQAKLAITDADARLTRQEEAKMGRWSKIIPGLPASERAYVSFLNQIRVELFDSMVATLGRGGNVTLEQAKVIANYVNVATGHGSLGKAEGYAVGLATVFFAPKYVLSRFQLLLGQPLWRGDAKTRSLIAAEYARALIGIGLFYGLAMLLGELWDDDDVKKPTIEWDSRATDFGKVRFGNTRVDPLMGLSQITVLISRLYTGQTKTSTGDIVPIRGDDVPYKGDTTLDVGFNFFRCKLAPTLGNAIDLIVGENLVHEKVTPNSVAKEMVIPLVFRDIYEAIQEHGASKGSAFSMLAIFGTGLQTYQSYDVSPEYVASLIYEASSTPVERKEGESLDEYRSRQDDRKQTIQKAQTKVKQLKLTQTDCQAILCNEVKKRKQSIAISKSGKLTAYGRRKNRLQQLIR